jgi:transcription antitermination factor NusG
LLPDHLLDAPEGPDELDREWWVLYVRPRQEKSLARQMFEKKVPFFLPLIRQPLNVRGRLMHSYVPLFEGYVFLLANREDRGKAIGTGRVVRALAVPDQEKLEKDLRQVHRLINSGATILPEKQHLGPGMTVEIREGSLAGMRGRILRTASGNRFVVQVNFIHQGASVLLDEVMLVKVQG